MTSRLAIMMGGRVAEEMVFGKEKVTSGAAVRHRAGDQARPLMVTRWGLSEELGTVVLRREPGRGVPRLLGVAPAEHLRGDRRKIDGEIRRLVEAGYQEAAKILTDKRADLETLAKGLLEFETLTGDEIKDLLNGKRPMRESVIEPTAPRSSAVPTAGKGRPRPDPARWSRSRRLKFAKSLEELRTSPTRGSSFSPPAKWVKVLPIVQLSDGYHKLFPLEYSNSDCTYGTRVIRI